MTPSANAMPAGFSWGVHGAGPRGFLGIVYARMGCRWIRAVRVHGATPTQAMDAAVRRAESRGLFSTPHSKAA